MIQNNYIYSVILDPDIRYAAFENLRPSFDFYLAQVQNIPKFFSALNDLNIEIRQMAMVTLGRLGTINPAYVIARMRSVLLQVCKIIYVFNSFHDNLIYILLGISICMKFNTAEWLKIMNNVLE